MENSRAVGVLGEKLRCVLSECHDAGAVER